MSRKHHAIYSDPTGAAAAASPAKRRAQRPRVSETSASETSSSNPARTAAPDSTVDRRAIARLAYSYWEARGYVGGSAEEDWLRAEREIREGLVATAVA
jgi:uncharacterized protein involved in copper resistance